MGSLSQLELTMMMMYCRLCLNALTGIELENFVLFTATNEETKFLKFVVKYLHLELTREDFGETASNKICEDCAKQLTNFDEFCTYVEEKQRILLNTVTPKYKDGDPELMENEIFLPSNDTQAIDSIKDELPLCEALLSNRSTPHSEFGGINDDDDSSDGGERLFDEKDTQQDGSNSSGEEDVPLKNLREIKISTREAKSKKSKSKQTKFSSKPKSKPNKALKTEENEEAGGKSSKKKLTEDDIVNEEIIASFLAVKCEICNIVESSFSELKRHFRTVHSCKGYLVCCGVRFKERYRLATHIKTHIDPNAYKCSICERILKSKKYLQRHMEDKHSKDEELKFDCSICGKKFANKNSAYRHTKVHNERTWKCELCNKSFKNKYVLEGHNQRLHGTFPNAFICHICGREYRFKPSFEKHVAEHKGIILDTSKQCEVCGEWFAKYDRHMDKHNHIDIKCSICGKETSSKAALRSHIEKVHKKRNRADTNASCTFCGKAFKYKKNLQEHITLHTDEKLYNCKYCEREFRSSANMYAHTKRAHTEEWLQAKLTRTNSKAPAQSLNQPV